MAKNYYTLSFEKFLEEIELKFQEYAAHVMIQWFVRLDTGCPPLNIFQKHYYLLSTFN